MIECPHSIDEAKNVPKSLRFAFYGFIYIIGIALGIYGIYQVISKLIK
jgi:hypothetical protein